MKLSDWQLTQLRDALRAYKSYGSDSGGRDYSWASVAEGVAEYTGIEVPSERLRQFIEGVNTKDGSRKYPVPSGERLKALVHFVTHEELKLISREEFEGGQPGYHALLRLLDYLDQAEGEPRLLPDAQIEGAYRAQRIDPEYFQTIEITLGQPSGKGLIEVREASDHYGPDIREDFDAGRLSSRQKSDLRRSRDTFSGWAVITPEDNMIFFLKNDRNGRNRYHLTMSADSGMWSQDRMMSLVLLDHEFPHEIDEQTNPGAAYSEVARQTSRAVMLFMRFDEKTGRFL
jgi:hypothetical protein